MMKKKIISLCLRHLLLTHVWVDGHKHLLVDEQLNPAKSRQTYDEEHGELWDNLATNLQKESFWNLVSIKKLLVYYKYQ